MNDRARSTTEGISSSNRSILPSDVQAWPSQHPDPHSRPRTFSPARASSLSRSAAGRDHAAPAHAYVLANAHHFAPQSPANALSTIGAIALRSASKRKATPLPKSPSVPTFHAKDDSVDSRPSTADEKYTAAAAPTIAPVLRSQSSATTNRALSQKRAPAYHSSYGVETYLGPPPSYSTQRTLSQDRVWKVDGGNRQAPPVTDDPRTHSSSSKTIVDSADLARPPDDMTHAQPGSTEVVSSPETLDSASIDTPKAEEVADMAPSMSSYGINIREDDQDATIRGLGVEHESRGSSSDERKSEDLFLSIAKTDAGRQQQSEKAERRRSRISLPFLSTTRPSVSHTRESARPDSVLDSDLLTPQAEVSRHASKRTSLNYHSRASTAQPPEHTNGRHESRHPNGSTHTGEDRQNLSPQEARGVGRRYSNAATDVGSRNYAQSHYSGPRSNLYMSEAQAVERPPVNEYHNTTESTISTTASTVWDELDDLKSRIRKLELTGKLPSSSAAAMSNAERPRTATTAATAATTLSSSPKHNKNNASPMQSAVEGVPSNVHPLLHEALGNARPVVSHDVYQKLQASSHDALQLAALMGSGAQTSSAASMGIPPSVERQLRRRADSMCRGLTELAIALAAEAKPAVSSAPRPGSRDASSTLAPNFVARRLSNEPTERSALPIRAGSRLDSRRTSLILGANRSGYATPDAATSAAASAHPQMQTSSAPSSRINRASTVLRNRRGQGHLDGADDEVDSPDARPPSRAVTEAGVYRQSGRDRASLAREYTSHHAMPTQFETTAKYRTPSSTAFLQRRHETPPSAVSGYESSPITSREGYGRIPVPSREYSAPPSAMPDTPENVTVTRGSGGSRRSLGIASRIGSSVGSRLRAVRAERYASREQQQHDQTRAEIMQSVDDPDEAAHANASASAVEGEA